MSKEIPKLPEKKNKNSNLVPHGEHLVPVHGKGGEIKKLVTAKEMSRRTFLRRAARAGILAGTTGAGLHVLQKLGESATEKMSDRPSQEHHAAEMRPTVLTPKEQFKMYDQLKNPEKGVAEVYRRHFLELTETGEGRRDMGIAADNVAAVGVERLVAPFVKKGLPYRLGYLIPIQETRCSNEDLDTEAIGTHQIMPATARAYGFKPEEANDVDIAGEIASRYAQDELKRFENTDMFFYAYIAGAGLFGFTKKFTKPREWTPENFYAYLEDYTPKNETEKESIVHALNYAPQIKAKYAALKHLGLVDKIEKPLEGTLLAKN